MVEPRVWLGCPIWGRKDWVGELLAPGTKSADFLRRYAEVFDAVEGNTTFYATPSADIVQRWADATPPTFRFCFKLPKTVTHERGLIAAAGATARFVDRLRPLGPRLGPLMIQLPPSFGPPRLSALESFVRTLPSGVRFAVEVRHPGFFAETLAERRLTALLVEHDIERVVLDTKAIYADMPVDEDLRVARDKKPRLPIPTVVEGRRPLLRLIVPPAPEVAGPRIDAWVRRVVAWLEQKRSPYVFLHCPNDFYAPRLARMFHDRLAEAMGWEPMPPWPAQRAATEAQTSLF
ncbi:MAG: DUF72 domain-containing protein [Nannocystaceae bacterium]|nr:DUF72 domain-containing protein [bacterium]